MHYAAYVGSDRCLNRLLLDGMYQCVRVWVCVWMGRCVCVCCVMNASVVDVCGLLGVCVRIACMCVYGGSERCVNRLLLGSMHVCVYIKWFVCMYLGI